MKKTANRDSISVEELIKIFARISRGTAKCEEYQLAEQFFTENARKKLYRYRPACYDEGGENRDLKALRENKMWFSTPEYVNDPFDCNFMMDADTIGKQIVKNASIQARLRGLPYARRVVRERELVEETKAAMQNNPNWEFLNHANRKFSVACMSENRASILMWGHYANGHRGICIEYALKDLQEEHIPFVPVRYCEEFPQIGAMDLVYEEKIFIKIWQRVLTKSKAWEYEAEWRRICDDAYCGKDWKGNGALLTVPAPTAIYIGCNAEDRLAEEVKQYCDEIGIPAYRMRASSLRFELKSELMK